MLKNFCKTVMALFALLVIVGIVMMVAGVVTILNPTDARISKNSIVALDLNGIIYDNRDFLDQLAKYRKDDHVKGILITINSPGGVVGPSQEIYEEIKRTSKEYKKPVYVYCGALAASGAYYAAVGADKIFATPGCTMGSIGVIMELVNLEKLYEWAKVQRYALTTGPYKDAGAEYKALTTDQRNLFQQLLTQVLAQFKKAVSEGRKMKMSELDKYADGRVFTGEDAVAKGFADQLGTWEDARRALGEAVGLGKDPEVFKPHKRKGIYAMLEDGDSDSLFKGQSLSSAIREFTHPELRATPLFVLPGAVGF